MKLTRRMGSLCILTVTFSLASTESNAQSDFLRGDVNNDGVVSISDARFMYNFLYRGGEAPTCLKAADSNDDGEVHDNAYPGDARLLLNHAAGRIEPCSPFAQLGPDPNPDGLSCESYGGGAPIDDPAAALEVEVGEVGADGIVPLTVLISSSRRIAGLSVELAAAGDAFADGTVAQVSWGDLYPQAGHVRQSGHKLKFSFLFDYLDRDRTVGPGSGIAVFGVHSCLREGLPAGEYPVEVLSVELVEDTGRAIHAPGTAGTIVVTGPVAGGCPVNDSEYPPTWPLHVCGGRDPQPQLFDFLRGDVNADGRFSLADLLYIRRTLYVAWDRLPCEEAGDIDGNGVLNGSDLASGVNSLLLGRWDEWPVAPFPEAGPGSTEDELGCGLYEVEEPEVTADVVEVGTTLAAPGQVVEIPILITSEVELEAVQLVIAYDPEMLEPSVLSFTGSYFEDVEDEAGPLRSARRIPGEDAMMVAFAPHILQDAYAIPPGEGQLVFSILAKVSEEAVPGTVLDLVPTNGPDGQGIGPARARNELTHRGRARYGTTLPATVPGLIQIVGDLSIFTRGDSNSDAKVDISDPLYTLGYLFAGEGSQDCRDASDANDDGRVDISDAVATLDHLFLGSGFLPPPSRSPGVDPTPDGLGCGAP